MSNDEAAVLLVSLAMGPAAWLVYLSKLSLIRRFRKSHAPLLTVAGVIVACTLGLWAILIRYAAPDVRQAPQYLALYLLLGLAWLRASEILLTYAGLSLRDDVIERNNAAALAAMSGALVGVTLCYAGGNIGSGPGWWVVVFCGALATTGLAAIWLLLEQTSGVTDVVTIDHDLAAGVRLAGLLAASGLILGRSVAGDWHSIDSTLADFARIGWVTLPLAGAAVAIERIARPTIARPRPAVFLAGILPAAAYLLLGAVYAFEVGWPP